MGARWECPNGKHPAVLAPTKPRKDDVRRYCLPCSEVKGRLVPRVASRLQNARSEALVRRKEASQAARETKKTKAAAYYTVDGVNMFDELVVIWRLPVVKEWLERRRIFRERSFRAQLPSLAVRRQTEIRRRLGTAYYNQHLIRLNVVDGISKADRVITTLLHEVVHIALGKIPGAPHGATFQATLRTIRAEYDALGRRSQVPPDDEYDDSDGDGWSRTEGIPIVVDVHGNEIDGPPITRSVMP